MNITAAIRTLVVYSLLPGLLVVSLTYYLTHSGFYVLVVAGVGLVLATAGAGGGAVGSGATERADAHEISGLMVERPSGGTYTQRELLILVGSGLLVWALVALLFFRQGLH